MFSMSLTGCRYHKPLHSVRPEPVEGPIGPKGANSGL